MNIYETQLIDLMLGENVFHKTFDNPDSIDSVKYWFETNDIYPKAKVDIAHKSFGWLKTHAFNAGIAARILERQGNIITKFELESVSMIPRGPQLDSIIIDSMLEKYRTRFPEHEVKFDGKKVEVSGIKIDSATEKQIKESINILEEWKAKQLSGYSIEGDIQTSATTCMDKPIKFEDIKKAVDMLGKQKEDSGPFQVLERRILDKIIIDRPFLYVPDMYEFWFQFGSKMTPELSFDKTLEECVSHAMMKVKEAIDQKADQCDLLLDAKFKYLEDKLEEMDLQKRFGYSPKRKIEFKVNNIFGMSMEEIQKSLLEISKIPAKYQGHDVNTSLPVGKYGEAKKIKFKS